MLLWLSRGAREDLDTTEMSHSSSTRTGSCYRKVTQPGVLTLGPGEHLAELFEGLCVARDRRRCVFRIEASVHQADEGFGGHHQGGVRAIPR